MHHFPQHWNHVFISGFAQKYTSGFKSGSDFIKVNFGLGHPWSSWSTVEMKKMTGNSDSSGRSGSSRRSRAWAVMLGMKSLAMLSTVLPASLLKSQEIKACWRSSLALEQRVHTGEVDGVRQWSLSLVTRSPCKSLKLKLVNSLPRPLRRLIFQIRGQSEVGDRSSALHDLYFLVSVISIVSPSSVSSLTHWLIDMVATFSGEFSCTCLMVVKKDGG